MVRTAVAYADGYQVTGLGSTDMDKMLGNQKVLLDRLLPRIMLPAEITAVVDDELQVFLASVIEAQSPYALPYNVVCDIGKFYPRYFDHTLVAGDVGNHTLTVTVRNTNYAEIVSGSTTVVVVDHVDAPAANKNILCLGDSLTYSTSWPKEAYRRLTQAAGTPAGLEYANISFIGDGALNTYTTQGYTGCGGWNADDFLNVADTLGHVLIPATTFDKDKTDVGSVWSDGTNRWILTYVDPETLVETGAELCLNPGFETWSDVDPGNWVSACVIDPIKETTLQRSGSNAVKLVNATSGWYDPQVASSANITVTPGETYRLSFWTRGDGANDGTYAVYDVTHSAYIPGHGPNGKATGVAGTTYKRVIDDILIPAGCVAVKIWLAGKNGAGFTCYYDDVSFKLLRAANRIKVVWDQATGTNVLAASGTLTHVSGAVHDGDIVYESRTNEPGTPFYSSDYQELSFTRWAARYSYTTLDAVYILLGWNEPSIQTPNNSLAADHATLVANVTALITKLRTDYPSVQVRVMGLNPPSRNGGLGDDYGATDGLSQFYGILRSLNGANLALEAMVADWTPAAGSWLRFVAVAPVFDGENNMQQADVAVNARSATTEKRGSNGVHPAADGFEQIADAAYRDVVRTYCAS